MRGWDGGVLKGSGRPFHPHLARPLSSHEQVRRWCGTRHNQLCCVLIFLRTAHLFFASVLPCRNCSRRMLFFYLFHSFCLCYGLHRCFSLADNTSAVVLKLFFIPSFSYSNLLYDMGGPVPLEHEITFWMQRLFSFRRVNSCLFLGTQILAWMIRFSSNPCKSF